MDTKVKTIQYLRGFASFYVVLTHLRLIYPVPENGLFYQWTAHGFSGVYLFFVISGFIITYTASERKGVQSCILYFKRRFIRIYPVYWFIFIPIALYGYIYPPDLYFRNFWIIIKNLFLVHTYETGILGVSWTLTFEILFYFIFGLSLLSRFFKLELLLLLWLFFYFLKIIYPDFPFSNSILTHSSCLEFILGCLIALALKKFTLKLHLLIPLIFLGYFILSPFLFQHYFTLSESLLSYKRLLEFSLPAFLVVMSFVFYEKSFSPKTNYFFLLLGNASYSIYLLHLPIIIFFKKIVNLSMTNPIINEFIFLFLLLFIISISIVFHKKVELALIERFKKWLV